jgi:hypothetical protein
MTGNLDGAIRTLLETALPALFGGATPPVSLSVNSVRFTVDKHSAEGTVSEARPDDRYDAFAFDPNSPPASFTLTQPPYPGPKRFWLTTNTGDRITLKDNEIVWDPEDNTVFSLTLEPYRDLSDVTGLLVLYAVVAVFTTFKAEQVVSVQLQAADASQVGQAEALASGVIQLSLSDLIAQSAATYDSGDYSVTVSAKSLKIIEGRGVAVDGAFVREIIYHAEIELKANRALRTDEGAVITRIITEGRPVDPNRAIDVHIGVDA